LYKEEIKADFIFDRGSRRLSKREPPSIRAKEDDEKPIPKLEKN
jgi:hypothetical protein